MNFRFNVGDNVRERITGFEGVIVARTEYLTGCNRYSIQSKTLNEGKPIEWQSFDEDMLEVIKEEGIKIMTDKTRGGIKPAILRNYK